jgi:hypothetical protein
MLAVTVHDNTTWEFHWWILGFEQLARAGEITLRFERGRRSPIPHEVGGWGSLTFTVDGGGPGGPRVGFVELRDGFEELNAPALARADAYFKFNYNPAHLDAAVAPGLRRRIHPIAFWFPIRRARTRALPVAGLRALRAAALCGASGRTLLEEDLPFGLRTFASTLRFPFLEDYTDDLANRPERTRDFFWKVSAWRTDDATGERIRVMKILEGVRAATGRRMDFGFVDAPHARARFPEYVLPTDAGRRGYLRDVAGASMSLVTHGVKDCFSWRMGEHLALRRFALIERPVNGTRVPLVEGRDAVFFESDLSDLADKLRFYLDRPDERERIALAGREFFDSVCAPAAQARAMLETLSETS